MCCIGLIIPAGIGERVLLTCQYLVCTVILAVCSFIRDGYCHSATQTGDVSL